MTRHAIGFIVGLLAASAARADIQVLKHDEFSSDLFVAVGQVQGQSLPVQPGFAQDEAYGLIFPIAAGSYPVKVLGLQMLFAAPPNAPDMKAHLRIEFYFDSSTGPAPSKGEPDWSVSTEDLYDPNTGGTGLPIQGGVGVQIDFDWSDPANHPPLMMSGNLWVVLRFYEAPQDLSEEWGSLQCLKMPELGACGCQKIGVLGDHAITSKVNVVHHVTAGCSGAKTWSYAENLGVTGDAIVRVKVETAGTCVPDCSGKQCGDDGCGASCGTCPAGQHCASGACVPDCVPDCFEKQCGDDGCGGTCGVCPAGTHCEVTTCVPDCLPDCAGKECGDDGCGGSCGVCLNWCDPDCKTQVPYEDPSLCHDGHCAQVCCPDCCGKECGDDGCGGVCGFCPQGKVCGASGDTWGQCVDAPCTPDCAGRECGDGGCPDQPDACGTCGAGEVCDDGACVTSQGVVVLEVSPAFGYEDEETPISVAGHGFQPGLALRLGGTLLGAIQVVGEGLATAVVPAGMSPGSYTLFASNPDGSSGFLKDAFEVRERPAEADQAPADTGPPAPDVAPGDPGPQDPGSPDLGPPEMGPQDSGPGDTGDAGPGDAGVPAAGGGGGGCSAGAAGTSVPWWIGLAGMLLLRRSRRDAR